MCFRAAIAADSTSEAMLHRQPEAVLPLPCGLDLVTATDIQLRIAIAHAGAKENLQKGE